MTRALCIWLPQWPLQRLLGAQPELRGQNVVLYALGSRGGLKVVACSGRGKIHPGMPLAEATALLEIEAAEQEPVLRADDPVADRLALEELAVWCQRFSPVVGLEDAPRPQCLLLDVRGLGPLFGGERALAEQVCRDFAQRGLAVRVAIADTPGAAWAVAHYRLPGLPGSEVPDASRLSQALVIVPPGETPAVLRGLPVAALRVPEETVSLLAELGLRRIGQVLSLPREALSSRFGS